MKIIRFVRLLDKPDGTWGVELFVLEREGVYYLAHWDLGRSGISFGIITRGNKATVERAFKSEIKTMEAGAKFKDPHIVVTRRLDQDARQHAGFLNDPKWGVKWERHLPSEVEGDNFEQAQFHKLLQRQLKEWVYTGISLPVKQHPYWPTFHAMVIEAVKAQFGSRIKLWRGVQGPIALQVLRGGPFPTYDYASWTHKKQYAKEFILYDPGYGIMKERDKPYWVVVNVAYPAKAVAFAPVPLPDYAPDPDILVNLLGREGEFIVYDPRDEIPVGQFKVSFKSRKPLPEARKAAAKGVDDLPDDWSLTIERRGDDEEITLNDETGKPVAHLWARVTDECGGVWVIRNVFAKGGWGPFLYDLAMERSGDAGLMADRDGASGEALRVWEHYLTRRSDVDHEHISEVPGMAGCYPLEEEALDFVYTKRKQTIIPALRRQGRWPLSTRAASLEMTLSPPSEHPAIGPERGRAKANGIVKLTSPHGSYRYLYYEDGEPVSGLQIVSRDGKTGMVANVYTLATHRRRGLARELLKRARRDFRKVVPPEEQHISDDGKAWRDVVQRVASRYLTARQQRIEDALHAALREFADHVKVIRRYHEEHGAGAVGPIDNAHQVLVRITNLISESGALSSGEDKRLRRDMGKTADYEMMMYDRDARSNEGLVRLAELYEGIQDSGSYKRLVERAIEAMPDKETTTKYGKWTIHNTGGYPPATLVEVFKVLKQVESKIGSSFPKLVGGDVYLVTQRQFGQFQTDPMETGALYHRPTDSIWMPPASVDDRDIVERTIHELGHRLWGTLPMKAWREWEEDWKARKDANGSVPFDFPTRYATKNWKEDFCEHFALAFMNKLPREGMKRLTPFLKKYAGY